MIIVWLIILALILLGLLFMLVEMLILPGVTFGAVLSISSFAGAIYLAFAKMSTMHGVAVIIFTIAVISITFSWAIMTGLWGRVELKEQLDSAVSPSPKDILPIGSRGITISRLAPMGRAKFGSILIEAKSQDVFIDPCCQVEIMGYENSAVIVKQIEK